MAKKKRTFVEIRTLARLRNINQHLTSTQRAQLVAIAQCHYQQLIAPIRESLANLGLVRLDGNRYLTTEDGRYIASLR